MAETVLIVSGDEEVLRRRFVDEVVADKKAEGWTIDDVDGSDPSAVRDALSGGGFFDMGASKLAVVANPTKIDLDLLKAHAKDKDTTTTLLLVMEKNPDGRTKFGKWVKAMKAVHRGFPKPKEWDAPAVATTFVEEEAERYGKTFSKGLAGALVSRVGVDLGMLIFEVQKLAMLLGSDETVIEARHVKGTMAQIAEAEVGPILSALEMRNAKKLSRALDRVKQTSKYDPTIRITRLLGGTAIRWMQAAHLDNLPAKVAAQELGVNAWYFENKVLPVAKRWGRQGTVELIAHLAAAERALLNGNIDPWSILVARLLTACQGRAQ